ncbi:hypothetical protein KKF86_07255 [bacterium]|nr:hypothetical protein [bacterium]
MPNYPYSDIESGMVNKDRLINDPQRFKPHVVILGAGASRQAFPTGDANGNIIPLMDDLVNVIGLEEDFVKYKYEIDEPNFELLYSRIQKENPESELLNIIERKVFKYFESLELPKVPTLYDYLLVSLRPKDIIATFNWDPFLFDAYNRNLQKISLPKILHLHGNVRVGYCKNHNFFGKYGEFCSECFTPYSQADLLYPVSEKNYSNEFIEGEWRVLESHLQNAFTLTIFGYSSPETDKKAFDLLQKNWQAKSNRELEVVEIIDIKDEDVVINHWKKFIHSHHYHYCSDFQKSMIPKFPRRSCESIYVPTILGKFAEEFSIYSESTFGGIYNKLIPMVEAEEVLNDIKK